MSPINKSEFPCLDIPTPRGRVGITAFSFGEQLADFGRVEIENALIRRQDNLGVKGYRQLLEATDPFLATIQAETPYSFALMRGLACGLNKDIHEVGALYFQELFNPESPTPDHCTTIVNPNGRGLIVAHNEEWNEPGDLLYTFRFTLDKGSYAIGLLGLAYKTEPPGGAFTRNSFGNILAVNSLHDDGNRIGVPRTVVAFEMATARDKKHAMRRIDHLSLASAMNYIFVSATGGINIETAGGDYDIQQINSQESFVHTNFIQSPGLKKHDNITPSKYSQSRFDQVTDQLQLRASIQEVINILSNTEDPKFPIFSHDTLATVYALTTEDGIHIRRNHQPDNQFIYYPSFSSPR